MPWSNPGVRVGLGSGLNRGSAGGLIAGLALGSGRSGWRGMESLGRALPLLAALGVVWWPLGLLLGLVLRSSGRGEGAGSMPTSVSSASWRHWARVRA